MTANSGISVTVLLSVLCLGIVMMFVGGWYLQSSLVELKIKVANQHEYVMEQKKEIMEHKNEILAQIVKATKEEDAIQQLKEHFYGLTKKLDALMPQLQNEEFQVSQHINIIEVEIHGTSLSTVVEIDKEIMAFQKYMPRKITL